jgi:hypothetical protein
VRQATWLEKKVMEILTGPLCVSAWIGCNCYLMEVAESLV